MLDALIIYHQGVQSADKPHASLTNPTHNDIVTPIPDPFQAL